jgi:hypothetical protein
MKGPGPFQPGHRLIALGPGISGGTVVQATVIALSETGKIQARLSWNPREDDNDTDTDNYEMMEIDPNHVLMEITSPLVEISTMSLKQKLRALWGNHIFGRVTRVVTRAQDVNIWYNSSSSSSSSCYRQYLGDNREVLKRFSRDEIRAHITLEYDFYFGFCGNLDRKQQRSREVPIFSRASDRIVNEDLEYLCASSEGTRESLSTMADDHVFHFSSSNFYQPRIFDSNFNPIDVDQVWETNTYSVVPPRLGSLICGLPVLSKRGVSLSKWWIAPESFFEFWKLLNSDRTYPPDYCTYNEMRRLKLTFDGVDSRFFQELAMCAVFEKPPSKLSQKTQFFIEALSRVCDKND